MELWSRRDHGGGGGDFVSAGDAKFGFYVPRKYWASRLAPYAGEWAGAAAMWPAAFGSHLWLGTGSAAAWASAGLTLLGAGLSTLTWKVGQARGAMTRRMATATVALGSAWFTAATIVGPTETPLLELWVFGGASVALAWNIKRALRSGDDEGSNALFEKVGLAKVRTGQIEAGPNKVTVPLALPAGDASLADVQKATDSLAQGLRLHKGSVRVTGDPDDLSQATMTIVPTDVLRHPQPWPGPSAPGGSIADPLVVGVYEDNEPVRIYLPGDPNPAAPRNATHMLVNGMNGAGKSWAATIGWEEILTRRDVVLIILDPSKGEQTAGFLPEDSAHLVIGEAECRKFIRRVPAAITAQADQLGKWGYDQWVPEAHARFGMPYTVLWVEEASKVVEDSKTMTNIVETARSAGWSVFLSQQRSTFRRMNTDIRAQLGGGWCFGVKDYEDAAFCLSEEVIDAGARPDRWANKRPGSFHLEAPGVPEERLAMPARSFAYSEATKKALTAVIEQHRDIRARLWPATAATLGLPPRPVRTTTIRPTDQATGLDPAQGVDQQGESVVSITTLPPRGEPGQGMPCAAEFADADIDDLPDLPDDLDAAVFGLPEEHEPDLGADADTALPEDTEVADMQLPRPRPTRAEARAKLRTLLERLAAKGQTEFTIRDLPAPERLFGRGRSWLSVELARLAEAGDLEPIGHQANAIVYRFTARPHTHGGNAA